MRQSDLKVRPTLKEHKKYGSSIDAPSNRAQCVTVVKPNQKLTEHDLE